MKKKIAAGIAATALAGGAVLFTGTAANAVESDISVVYSTQNTASAPIDGSYTVHGRVGQTRDDMVVTYTILGSGTANISTVTYPMPVINYTGDLVDTADATYTFRFGCDTTIQPQCSLPIVQANLAAMNADAAALDGHSISDFVADVTPIIEQYGDTVPRGITGTVTVSVISSVPGTGEVEFYLEQQQTGERLSPTVIAPLSITEPTIAPMAATESYCVAGLESYTSGGVVYTPNNYGQDEIDVTVDLVDGGVVPDDSTQVGVDDDGVSAVLSGSSYTDPDDLYDAELALTPGTYTVTYNYTAPDDVPADSATQTIMVLGEGDPACYSTAAAPGDGTTPVTPTTPTKPATLAETGASDTAVAGFTGIGLLLAGALAFAAPALRRRFASVK